MGKRPKILISKKLSSYKDIHKNKKFLVCGLGPSIIDFDFEEYKDYIKIGVNDIEKYFTPDYIVLIDSLKRFNEKRQATIINGKCNNIFTQIEQLTRDFVFKHERLVLMPIKSIASNPRLSNSHILFSNNSTFVACDLARFMGASEIKIIGMDFKNHIELNTEEAFNRIKDHFTQLEKLLKQQNIKIENLSKNTLVNFTN